MESAIAATQAALAVPADSANFKVAALQEALRDLESVLESLRDRDIDTRTLSDVQAVAFMAQERLDLLSSHPMSPRRMADVFWTRETGRVAIFELTRGLRDCQSAVERAAKREVASSKVSVAAAVASTTDGERPLRSEAVATCNPNAPAPNATMPAATVADWSELDGVHASSGYRIGTADESRAGKAHARTLPDPSEQEERRLSAPSPGVNKRLDPPTGRRSASNVSGASPPARSSTDQPQQPSAASALQQDRHSTAEGRPSSQRQAQLRSSASSTMDFLRVPTLEDFLLHDEEEEDEDKDADWENSEEGAELPRGSREAAEESPDRGAHASQPRVDGEPADGEDDLLGLDMDQGQSSFVAPPPLAPPPGAASRQASHAAGWYSLGATTFTPSASALGGAAEWFGLGKNAGSSITTPSHREDRLPAKSAHPSTAGKRSKQAGSALPSPRRSGPPSNREIRVQIYVPPERLQCQQRASLEEYGMGGQHHRAHRGDERPLPRPSAEMLAAFSARGESPQSVRLRQQPLPTPQREQEQTAARTDHRPLPASQKQPRESAMNREDRPLPLPSADLLASFRAEAEAVTAQHQQRGEEKGASAAGGPLPTPQPHPRASARNRDDRPLPVPSTELFAAFTITEAQGSPSADVSSSPSPQHCVNREDTLLPRPIAQRQRATLPSQKTSPPSQDLPSHRTPPRQPPLCGTA